MWDKYKTKFACNRLEFGVINGNILKYSINCNFDDFILILADHYNVDFLFADPANGKTVINYIDEELTKTSKNGEWKLNQLREMKKVILEKRKYNPATHEFDTVK